MPTITSIDRTQPTAHGSAQQIQEQLAEIPTKKTADKVIACAERSGRFGAAEKTAIKRLSASQYDNDGGQGPQQAARLRAYLQMSSVGARHAIAEAAMDDGCVDLKEARGILAQITANGIFSKRERRTVAKSLDAFAWNADAAAYVQEAMKQGPLRAVDPAVDFKDLASDSFGLWSTMHRGEMYGDYGLKSVAKIPDGSYEVPLHMRDKRDGDWKTWQPTNRKIAVQISGGKLTSARLLSGDGSEIYNMKIANAEQGVFDFSTPDGGNNSGGVYANWFTKHRFGAVEFTAAGDLRVSYTEHRAEHYWSNSFPHELRTMMYASDAQESWAGVLRRVNT